MSVTHNTFVIERNYAKPASVLFAAFADPVKLRRWYAASDPQDVIAFESDFRVGGDEINAYRLPASSPFPGVEIVQTGRYLDIVPDRRIVTASSTAFAGNRISASLVTIELETQSGGVKLTCTHQGAFFEGSDGPVIREAGWRKILDRLGDAI